MKNEWLDGEMNYIELQKLDEVDIEELMFVSSMDENTSFRIADRAEEMVTVDTAMEYGFYISLDEKEEAVYLKPFAELHNVRKFEVTIYDMEEMHVVLENEADMLGIECEQDHDEPAVYHTELNFPPIRIDSNSESLQQNDSLSKIMKNIMEQGEKLYASAVVKTIDHTIKEAQLLRKEFETKLLG